VGNAAASGVPRAWTKASVPRRSTYFSFLFIFFAEDLQHECFSGSVFKESRNNKDCTDQANDQPEDSRNEKRKDDQNAPQDGTNDRLLLSHVFCFDHGVHFFSLLKKVAVFFYYRHR
jgi:hypothetical protein